MGGRKERDRKKCLGADCQPQFSTDKKTFLEVHARKKKRGGAEPPKGGAAQKYSGENILIAKPMDVPLKGTVFNTASDRRG